MSKTATVPPAPEVRTRAMRSESLRLWGLLAVLGGVLGTVGTLALVLAPVQRQLVRQSTERELAASARLLAHMVEPLIADERQGEARTLLTAAVQEQGLLHGAVVLADGGVLVQSLAGRSHAGKPADTLKVSQPLVLSQGEASLDLVGMPQAQWWTGMQAQLAAGLLAVGGVGVLLVASGRVRARFRVLHAVGDALLSMREGEQAAAALAVDTRFGEEAAAWNALLDECEELRHELTRERARDSLHNRSDGRGDLGQACDALWQGMLLVDEALNVKYANGAAAVFLKAKKEALIGADAASITDLITDDQVLCAVQQVASGEMRRRTTHEVRRSEAEGGGILRFNVRPVRRDDAAAALIIIEDITQQRIADEARNAFVAQVTHELRTPLTNIRLYVEQAIEEGENDPVAVAQALNVINLESRRLERIVGDMLSVSEIEAGSFRLRTADVRLDTLFDELEADYRPQAESKDITLEFHLPPKLPTIMGDRDKIVLALHNLIGNAVKYTSEGGRIDVRVDIDEASGQLNVEVQDTGIGIDPEEADLIFDKFYRARDKRVSSITGTGLGLALAREVVRLHGGDISVRSQLDQGSTFTLNLPALARAA